MGEICCGLCLAVKNEVKYIKRFFIGLTIFDKKGRFLHNFQTSDKNVATKKPSNVVIALRPLLAKKIPQRNGSFLISKASLNKSMEKADFRMNKMRSLLGAWAFSFFSVSNINNIWCKFPAGCSWGFSFLFLDS